MPAGWQREPARAPFALGQPAPSARCEFRVTPPAAGASSRHAARRSRIVDGDARAYIARRGAHRARAHPDPDAARRARTCASVRVDVARKGKAHRLHPRARATRCRPPAQRRLRRRRCSIRRDAHRAADLAGASTRSSSACARSTPSQRLRGAHDALMAYVERGGTLVVQYNTNNRLAPLTAPLGPCPFDDLAEARHRRDRDGDVAMPRPTPCSPTPNAIGAARLRRLGAGARPLLRRRRGIRTTRRRSRCTIPASRARRAALLVARHGKGTFVYTGLAFFRQLPAGVPGAYRLFANLLAGMGERPDDAMTRCEARARAWTTRRRSRLARIYLVLARWRSRCSTRSRWAYAMSALDWVVLVGTLALIVAYGVWKTRGASSIAELPARRLPTCAGRRSASSSWPRRRARSRSCRRPARPTRTACASCSSTSACRSRW